MATSLPLSCPQVKSDVIPVVLFTVSSIPISDPVDPMDPMDPSIIQMAVAAVMAETATTGTNRRGRGDLEMIWQCCLTSQWTPRSWKWNLNRCPAPPPTARPSRKNPIDVARCGHQSALLEAWQIIRIKFRKSQFSSNQFTNMK